MPTPPLPSPSTSGASGLLLCEPSLEFVHSIAKCLQFSPWRVGLPIGKVVTQHGICADKATLADVDRSQDLRPGHEGRIVSDLGIAVDKRGIEPAFGRSPDEDAGQDVDIGPDLRSPPNDDAGCVRHEKPAAYLRGGMDIRASEE